MSQARMAVLSLIQHLQCYTLPPTPYALHPTPYTLHTLHPTPHTPHPTPKLHHCAWRSLKKKRPSLRPCLKTKRPSLCPCGKDTDRKKGVLPAPWIPPFDRLGLDGMCGILERRLLPELPNPTPYLQEKTSKNALTFAWQTCIPERTLTELRPGKLTFDKRLVVHRVVPGLVNNFFTEMCSGSEAGSYLRLIDFVYHSTLGLGVMKKQQKYLAAFVGVVLAHVVAYIYIYIYV